MNKQNVRNDRSASQKQKKIADRFELLRGELDKYVSSPGGYNKGQILEISRELDALHLEYIKSNDK